MKKSLSARRVPRKIGSEDDDNATDLSSSAQTDSTVKRPSSKPRKSTSLRQSFGPSAVNGEDEIDASVVTPRRNNLSRIAVHKNAAKRSSLLASQLPTRTPDDDDERPSYSAASLQELKASTPSTPKDLSATSTDVEDVSTGTQALDLSSKFGASLSRYQQQSASSVIPSAAEIAEKKARRARLAKEEQAEEYISLDPDDPNLDEEDLDENVMRDDRGRLVLKPKDKYGLSESRLVHEDEDILENFDEFTEDGKIALGRKAEQEATRKRKQEMAAQIAEAEGASDAESDASERERNEAFEAAQTKHGSYAQTATEADPAAQRPRTPPIITPLPTLEGAIERLRNQLAEMQSSRLQKLQEMEALQRQKIQLAEDEVRIQRSLKATADKFEQLRKEKGIGGSKKEELPVIEAAPLNGTEGLGADEGEDNGTGMDAEPEADDVEDQEADARPAFGGLGFGSGRPDLPGFGLGFQRSSHDHDDSG